MARLIHLNGPPGIGKSTLAALYADDYPGTLNLDVDVLHRLIGGWRDPNNRTWDLAWPLVHSLASTHLRAGHDVVLPQYHARLDEITTLETLAHHHGASFQEVVLLDSRDSATARFDHRAQTTDDPWIQHHQRFVTRDDLVRMYDALVNLVPQLPDAQVVSSTPDAIHETYDLLSKTLGQP
ncbi:hypothetical protein BWI15_27345 [Kribbella sp. ALI-6-A]|uniref:AAA family ATPase n=1 Tax=Kribbella sp. ALI-6-A TaxID=1933817 RepID=UPI00097C2A9E|nr:AAA family ATPase [Kribbella sp. ALI-6-A]ONI66905.1 hypothetical protein BWI15_27345 [Kribbella sp. ALI-6-A]